MVLMGFGSTGTDKMIKKYKLENEDDVIIESVKMSDKSEESESENDDVIIESAKMSVNDKIIIESDSSNIEIIEKFS